MGFNGSGGYDRVHNWVTDKNAGVKIQAARMDAEMDDMASAFELCLLKDGQQLPTDNLPMNSKKHTNVAAASARSEYLDGATLQDGGFIWAGTATGASAITANLNPGITAYVTGMRVGFIAAGNNASAVTLNISGVSAAALVKGKNDPLVANDIVSGQAVWATYKGADGFQIGEQTSDNPTFITLTTTGLATLGNVLCSGSAVFTSSLNVTGTTNLSGPINLIGDVTASGKAVFASAVSVAGAFIHADNAYPASAGLANDIIISDGAGNLAFGKLGTLSTETGAIILTTGSPTIVALASSLVGVNEIKIHIENFSTDAENQSAMIQIGDSGGLEIAGYSGYASIVESSFARSANSTGFLLSEKTNSDAANVFDFFVTLKHMGSNIWSINCDGIYDAGVSQAVGLKTLSGALTQVSITTSGGSAILDGGVAYITSK